MITSLKRSHHSQSSLWRQFGLLIAPSLLALSTALTSCSVSTKQATSTSPTNNPASNPSKSADKPVAIKTKVIRVGYQSSGDLTKVRGVLEKRLESLGVKVEWSQFAAGPQLMEALNVGKVDIGSVGETPPIFAQAAGSQLVYVVARKPSEGKGSGIIVQKDSPIKTVADLKGQKVVFQKGSASHYLIVKALEEVGLKYSDIQPVTLPPVEAREAFFQGKIDAWVTWDPYLALAETKGNGRIIRDAHKIATQGGFYIASRSFAKDNLDLLRIVIEEIDKSGQWAEANRAEVVKLVAPILKIEPEIQEIVTSRASYRLRPISPQIIESQQKIADLFTQEKVIPKKLDLREVILTPEQYAAMTPESLKDSNN